MKENEVLVHLLFVNEEAGPNMQTTPGCRAENYLFQISKNSTERENRKKSRMGNLNRNGTERDSRPGDDADNQDRNRP